MSGPLRIPAVRISGSVGVSRDENQSFAVRSEATTLEVRPPQESFSDDWWLVARDVTVEDGWSKPLDELRVGDHVMRRVEVTVAGVTGAHLPELEQGRSNGLTVLPGRTERQTEITPTGVIGKISRHFDIRIDNDQPINISPVRVVWWNTASEIERRTAAPAIRIEPLPRDVEGLVSSLMEEAATARERSRAGVIAILFGLFIISAATAFWLMRSYGRIRREDRILHRSLAIDDSPAGAIRALLAWREATCLEQRPASLDHISRDLGPKAKLLIIKLQRAVFAEKHEGQEQDPLDAKKLVIEVLQLARKKRKKPLKAFLSNGMDRLLGPKRRLPPLEPVLEVIE